MPAFPVFDGDILYTLADKTCQTINEECLPDKVSKSLKDIAFFLQDRTGRSRDAGAPCLYSPMFDQSANCLRT